MRYQCTMDDDGICYYVMCLSTRLVDPRVVRRKGHNLEVWCRRKIGGRRAKEVSLTFSESSIRTFVGWRHSFPTRNNNEHDPPRVP